MDIDKNELIERPSTEPLRQDSAQVRTRIKTVIDMESRSASMAPITPLYISRMLNVPLEEVEEAMASM